MSSTNTGNISPSTAATSENIGWHLLRQIFDFIPEKTFEKLITPVITRPGHRVDPKHVTVDEYFTSYPRKLIHFAANLLQWIDSNKVTNVFELSPAASRKITAKFGPLVQMSQMGDVNHADHMVDLKTSILTIIHQNIIDLAIEDKLPPPNISIKIVSEKKLWGDRTTEMYSLLEALDAVGDNVYTYTKQVSNFLKPWFKARPFTEEQIEYIVSPQKSEWNGTGRSGIWDPPGLTKEVSAMAGHFIRTRLKQSLRKHEHLISRVGIDFLKNIIWLRYHKATSSNGSAVGFSATEAISEPSTQMTLKSFHFVGGVIDMATGGEAVKELLEAVKDPKKTQMTIHFNRDNLSYDEIIEKRNDFEKLLVGDVIIESFVSSTDGYQYEEWVYDWVNLTGNRLPDKYFIRIEVNVARLMSRGYVLDDFIDAVKKGGPQEMLKMEAIASPFALGIVYMFGDNNIITHSKENIESLYWENSMYLFLKNTVTLGMRNYIIGGIAGINTLIPNKISMLGGTVFRGEDEIKDGKSAPNTYPKTFKLQLYRFYMESNGLTKERFFEMFKIQGMNYSFVSIENEENIKLNQVGSFESGTEPISGSGSGSGLYVIDPIIYAIITVTEESLNWYASRLGVTRDELPVAHQIMSDSNSAKLTPIKIVSAHIHYEKLIVGETKSLEVSNLRSQFRKSNEFDDYVPSDIKQIKEGQTLEEREKIINEYLDSYLDSIGFNRILNKIRSTINENKIADVNMYSDLGVLMPISKASTFTFGLTSGSNLAEVMRRFDVDQLRTYTSNINEVYHMLGIEAARTLLVRRLHETLNGHKEDGDVDPRHITLIIDYMTNTGVPTSIKSTSSVRQHNPLLAKSTQRSAYTHMVVAAAMGEQEKATSTSTRVAIGAVPRVGTGAPFDIIIDRKRDAKLRAEYETELLSKIERNDTGTTGDHDGDFVRLILSGKLSKSDIVKFDSSKIDNVEIGKINLGLLRKRGRHTKSQTLMLSNEPTVTNISLNEEASNIIVPPSIERPLLRNKRLENAANRLIIQTEVQAETNI
jgi:hypothetical protein